jgi:wee1-like protein kinase
VIDQQQYAVKKIRVNLRSQYDRKRAIHEAFALAGASVNDDNRYVIRYHTVWVEGGMLYMSMELCDCSLSRLISREGVVARSETFILQLMRDICKGLKKLHANRIVHLDIKSENILRSFSGRFKLGDLGLACMLNNLGEGEEDIPEGDSRYLAPELLDIIPDDATSIPDLTKCDIFSLGATVLEIMRGEQLPKNGPDWHRIRDSGDGLVLKGEYSKQLK